MIDIREYVTNTNHQILFYTKDRSHKITYANEKFAEMEGVDSPKKIIGKNDHQLICKPQAKLYEKFNEIVMTGKALINIQFPRTSANKIATILATAIPIHNKKNEIIGVSGYNIDITGHTLKKINGHINPEKNTFSLGAQFNNEYFTRREFEVFKYLLMGKSVEEMTLTLARSPKTIQSQIKSIANKLQCSHKSEIVPAAIQYGLTHVLDDIGLEKN